MRMCVGNRGLTRAELGITLCSSSCKGMAHQIPAAPLSSSSRTGGGTPKHHQESPPSPRGGAVRAPLKPGSAAPAGLCTPLPPPLTSTLRKPPRRRT